MHEMAMAQCALEMALKAANDNKLTEVDELRFRKCSPSTLHDNTFRLAFASLSKNTIAEHANLIMEVIPTADGCGLELTHVSGRRDCCMA